MPRLAQRGIPAIAAALFCAAALCCTTALCCSAALAQNQCPEFDLDDCLADRKDAESSTTETRDGQTAQGRNTPAGNTNARLPWTVAGWTAVVLAGGFTVVWAFGVWISRPERDAP